MQTLTKSKTENLQKVLLVCNSKEEKKLKGTTLPGTALFFSILFLYSDLMNSNEITCW